MKYLIRVSLVVLALLAWIAPAFGQDDDDLLFNLVSRDPVVPNGKQATDWDRPYTDPGAVVYHDGQFHMFRNGFRGWPAPVQVGYLTSPDGVTWTEVSEDPVFTTDEVSYAGLAMLASDVMVAQDGTWILYFYTWESSTNKESGSAIGRATASSPSGPWTPDPAPILVQGSDGEWDDFRVFAPRVVRTDDGYLMYYAGQNKEGVVSGQIGMALSEDGINWTKYDDPATTEAPFAESDPILSPFMDGSQIGQPMVEYTDEDGWVMIFREAQPATRSMSLFQAVSEDGIHWELASDEPFFTKDDTPRRYAFWYTALEHHDDTYYLYIEAGGSQTQIYVATHEGSLP